MKKLIGFSFLFLLSVSFLTLGFCSTEYITLKEGNRDTVEFYHSPYIKLKIIQNDKVVSKKKFITTLDDFPEDIKNMIIGMKEQEKRQIFFSTIDNTEPVIYEIKVIKNDKAKLKSFPNNPPVALK